MTTSGSSSSNTSNNTSSSNSSRYLQLAVLVVVGGCVYPLVYLRGNYEISMLQAFGISVGELAECYALLGTMFVLTYLPSGWLADRVSCRGLIVFSLVSTGLLGIWFSTLPTLVELRVIYIGWGVTTGLTFWSALIKAVAVLARPAEQGRFFGIHDGGRGLVEAALATVAIAWFASVVDATGGSTTAALQQVIYFYTACLLIMAPVAYFAVDDIPSDPEGASVRPGFSADLKLVLGRFEIWLCGFCILCGYQLAWSTGSISAFLQQTHGMTAVTVGAITVAQMWMRPVGAIGAGILGDLTRRELVLAGLFVLASVALLGMTRMPTTSGVWLMLAVVLFVGLMTSAVRGIYWGTLESCAVPTRAKGLAIGVISLVGYSPDVYLPLVYGALLERFPGQLGYNLFFVGVALMGLAGALAAGWLSVIVRRRAAGAGAVGGLLAEG